MMLIYSENRIKSLILIERMVMIQVLYKCGISVFPQKSVLICVLKCRNENANQAFIHYQFIAAFIQVVTRLGYVWCL